MKPATRSLRAPLTLTRYGRVLIGCDREGLLEASIPSLAALLGRDDPQLLVVAVEESGQDSELRRQMTRSLERVTAALEGAGLRVRQSHRYAKAGGVARELARAAVGWNADLLVLGSHRPSTLRGLLTPSVGHQVARRSRMPILIAGDLSKERQATVPARVLAAVKPDHRCWPALESAAGFAGHDGAVRVVHVIESMTGPEYVLARPPGAYSASEVSELLTDSLAALHQAGVGAATATSVTVDGSIASGIISEADRWGADVIVVASRRRRELGWLLFGSIGYGLVLETRRFVCFASASP